MTLNYAIAYKVIHSDVVDVSLTLYSNINIKKNLFGWCANLFLFYAREVLEAYHAMDLALVDRKKGKYL